MAKLKLKIDPILMKAGIKGVATAFKKVGKDFDKNMKATFENFKKVGPILKKSVKMAGIGIAITGAVIGGASKLSNDLVKEFAVIDRGLREITTLTDAGSILDYDTIKEEVRKVSKELKMLPDDVIPAVYAALSAGRKEEEVFDFLRTAGKGAIAGVSDINTAVATLSTLENTFGTDTRKNMDIIFNTIKGGVTTFNELGGAIGNVASRAAAMGLDISSVFAAIQQGTKVTGAGSTNVVVTQLSALLNSLSDVESQASKAFEMNMGLNARDFLAAGGDVIDVIDGIKKGLGQGESITDFFTRKEAKQMALILSENNDEYREAVKLNKELEGSAEEAFKKMDQGIGRALDSWNSFKRNFQLELGEELAPTFELFLEELKIILNENKEGIKNFLRMVMEFVKNQLPLIAGTIKEIIPKIKELVDQIARLFERLDKVGNFAGGVKDVLTGKHIWEGIGNAAEKIKEVVTGDAGTSNAATAREPINIGININGTYSSGADVKKAVQSAIDSKKESEFELEESVDNSNIQNLIFGG
jgi:TP901 family phage tail tape measure protein